MNKQEQEELLQLVDNLEQTIGDINEPFISQANDDFNKKKAKKQIKKIRQYVTGHGTGGAKP